MADDKNYIIKMPDEDIVPQFGLGYEIFHKMQLRLGDIAEFIADTDRSVTFGELLDNSKRVAINLKKLNLADDEIVSICALNHEHTCTPYIAGLFNGNIVTCLDPFLPPSDKALMLGKVKPKILFVDEEFLQDIEATLKIVDLDIKIVVFGKITNGHTPFEEFLIATPEEIGAFEPIKINNNAKTAIIVFTSGTTGAPKGICFSHLAVLSCTGGFSIDVTFSSTSPMWISYGLLLIRCLREGGARVLCKNFDISQLWRIINRYKVTMIAMTVYESYRMIEIPLDGIDISSLTLMTCVGAALPLELRSRLKEVLPNVHVLQAYGLTEACGMCLAFNLGLAEHREFFIKKPESCGAPIPGVWYKLVDPETEEVLGPNTPGELRVKTKFMMQGFYNEDSTECFDSDGYLKTGDILQYDEDRCFFFIERLKELLKYRSYKWSPTELENIILRHPAVLMAAVIGIPNAENGHLPMGIVKLRPNCKVDPEELVEYVDRIVHDNKKLRAGVKIVDDLPVTVTGKIHKKKLRDMILAGEKS